MFASTAISRQHQARRRRKPLDRNQDNYTVQANRTSGITDRFEPAGREKGEANVPDRRGAGFLGLNTARVLAADGHDVVITTRRRSDPLAPWVIAEAGGRIALEVVDLNNSHEVYGLFSRYPFTTVAHTATNHMFA